MLEALVRPFAHTRNVTSGVRHTYVPRATTGPVPEPEEGVATICWGKVGALPEPLSSGFNTLRCEEEHIENERETDDIRITNPDDPEQWVEVRRANTLIFKKTNNRPRSASDHDTSYNIGENNFDDFNASVRAGFELDDGNDDDECKLTVRLDNGPTSA